MDFECCHAYYDGQETEKVWAHKYVLVVSDKKKKSNSDVLKVMQQNGS
jgi:hypothetical protein